MKKIYIKTYGCQMNVYDSERMYELMKPHGYKISDKYEESDLIILNTCHIREKAAEKIYSELGRIAPHKKQCNEQGKKLNIVVAGCVAQAEGKEIIKRQPIVDIVVGPQTYHRLPEILNRLSNKSRKIVDTDFPIENKFDELKKIRTNTNPVSFLSIQEGCDKFCSFCVVPYTRGPEYSRPFNKIISEAEELIKNGTKEIILLGQNVNAYSFKEKVKEYRISDLINKLETYSELKRIRYTTSHPRDMTDDLIECYSKSKKLMPLVHLPIQSGSNKILKLMNRKHTVEKYIEIYEKLIKINPKLEFSSDFIVAYPSETENDFNETLNLVKKIKFINSFSFIFSPRPGTVASNLDQIDNKIAKERLLKIQEYLFKFQLKKNESFINKSIDVLVENEIAGQNKLFGRNKYMNSVIFEGDKNFIGKNVNIKIDKVNQNSLFGKVEKNNMRAA